MSRNTNISIVINHSVSEICLWAESNSINGRMICISTLLYLKKMYGK